MNDPTDRKKPTGDGPKYWSTDKKYGPTGDGPVDLPLSYQETVHGPVKLPV